MSKRNAKIWMVRAGRGSVLIDEFINKEIVAIGWNELGKLPKSLDYEGLKNKLRTVYPDDVDGRINQSTGQLWKLFKDFSKGDKVITYDSNARVYYLGEIISDYQYSDVFEYHHYRKVEWYDEPVQRDFLEMESKNTLGSILTIFEVPNKIWEELHQLHPGYISDEELKGFEEARKHFEAQELQQLKEDAVFRSLEFIKDIVFSLSWQDSEKLVAGVLRAMGYKTRLTGRGADLGSDIIASPDGLEMLEPIIKVEVKHKVKSKGKIGAPDLRNFIGGLRLPTKGIYVSTTGFSKDAKIEAERANFQITLVDLDRLVELIIEYYDLLDQETKALVPLKKIYWPI